MLNATYVEAAFQLAVTSELHKHYLIQTQAHQVKRLINRTSTAFINVSHIVVFRVVGA